MLNLANTRISSVSNVPSIPTFDNGGELRLSNLQNPYVQHLGLDRVVLYFLCAQIFVTMTLFMFLFLVNLLIS